MAIKKLQVCKMGNASQRSDIHTRDKQIDDCRSFTFLNFPVIITINIRLYLLSCQVSTVVLTNAYLKFASGMLTVWP